MHSINPFFKSLTYIDNISLNSAMKQFATTLLFSCHFFIAVCQTPTFTNVGSEFDLSKTEYAGLAEELLVSSFEATPTSINFNLDGTKMFVGGTDDNAIVEFLLSDPYDVSSASFVGEFTITEGSIPFDFKFNNDGTKMFVVGINDAVVEYSLSSAFDISTVSYAGIGEQFSIKSQEEAVRGLAFGQNGSKMFVIGSADKAVVEYDLSVAYDVSTANYNGIEFSVENEETIPGGLGFNLDGTRFYTIGLVNRAILEYTMSSAYDISSAVFTNELSLIGEEGNPNDFAFSNLGNKFFMVGSTDQAVVEYTLTSEISYDENSTTEVIDIGATDGISSTEDLNVTYALSGDDASLLSVDASGMITFSSSPDFESPSDMNGDNVYEITVKATANATDATQKLEIAVIDVRDAPQFSSVGTGFDVSNGIYANNSFLVEDEDRNPQGLAFSNDGKKMFMLGQNNNVFQYDLLTPYDLSNVTLVDDFGVVFQFGMTFNTSGTKMFLTGSNRDVGEYDLSVAFDLSTASFTQEFDITNQELSPQGVAFSSDGTKMFVAGSDGDAVVEYALGTAFDVSTASYSGAEEEFSVSAQETDLSDLTFSSDGTKLFIVGGADDAVVEYELDVAFDVSTAVYSGADEELVVQDIEGNLRAVRFNFNGTKMFIIGSIGDAVFEYELASNVSYDENGSTTVLDVDANDGVGGLDDSSISYSLSGADAGQFAVDTNGNITFNSSPDFESPADANGDNVYEFEIAATNSFTSSSQRTLVSVQDVDDTPPAFTTSTATDFAENGTGVAYTAGADEEVIFALGNTKDESLFALANESEISFLSAPDFENPEDGDSGNDYVIDVIATDNAGNETNLEVIITVTDEDEIAPTFTSGTTASINENTTGTIYTASADETANFTLGSSKDEALFTVTTDAISFTVAADFENPLDSDENNEYLVDVIATDGANNATTLEVTITVTDQDEIAPTFTSAASTVILENTVGGIYTATADESVVFTLGSGKDEALFNLSTDVISFNAAPDFENPQDGDLDNEYLLDIVATDAGGNVAAFVLSIVVTDLDEVAPTFTSGSTLGVLENTEGTIYTAFADETVTFSLGSNKDEALFSLAVDQLSFLALPDFENPLDAGLDNNYLIDLIATDADGNASTMEVTISVTDVDEVTPTFTSGNSVSIDENTEGTIYTAAADEVVTFSLGSGKDEGRFSLANDEVSFTSAPDFEDPQDGNTDNVYIVDVIATDDADNVSTLEVMITVTDTDEVAPTFTSGTSVSVEENSSGAIYSAVANESVTFSLGSSKDEGLFTLATDVLSFSSSPNFEDPQDSNVDNVYLIDMIATDAAANVTTLIVTIIVTDQDEIAPTLTSGTSISITENTTGTIYIVAADESVTFSLGSSKDEGVFTLSTDELSFTVAPDFENPQDSNGDNEYLLDVTATDASGNATTIVLAVAVTAAPLSASEMDEIAIYPNPVSDRFSINGHELSHYSKLVISDSEGRTVLSFKELSPSVFDVSSLGEGVYFIHLESEEETKFAGRLIKSKN